MKLFGIGLVGALALAACREEPPPAGPVFSLRERAPGAQVPAPAAEPTPAAEAAFPSVPLLTGTISIAPALAQAALPVHASLFIMARPHGGAGGAPVLVKRVVAPKFPYDFVLSTDDQMSRGAALPPELSLSARLDSDGDAISRTPGDLMGTAKAPVSSGANGVALVLDELVREAKPSAPVR